MQYSSLQILQLIKALYTFSDLPAGTGEFQDLDHLASTLLKSLLIKINVHVAFLLINAQ